MILSVIVAVCLAGFIWFPEDIGTNYGKMVKAYRQTVAK